MEKVMDSLESKVANLLNKYGKTIFSRSDDVVSDVEFSFLQFVNNRYVFEEYRLFETKDFEQIFIKLIEQVGGEGEGEVYYYILEFSEGENRVLARLNAFYTSYNGADYQGWDFVKPVQVMVTQYEKV